MRVALTGGAGFIGSHLAQAFLAEGHQLLVIDDLSSGFRQQVPPEATFVQADLRSAEAAAALTAFRPEVLDHHAAQVDVRHSISDPRHDCEVNLVGFLNVVEAARKAGALERVVLASSGGTIYGEPGAAAPDEQAPAFPLSPYGVTKRASELYLEAFGRMYGLHSVALRYSNVFGPRQNPHAEAGVIAIFVKRCLEGQPCTLFGDGTQTRDFVFVDDVVRANLLAMRTPHRGVVNIGTGVETDLNGLYQRVARACGAHQPPVYAPTRLGELRRNVLDVRLAARVLGWRPEVSLDEGLARCVEWLRAQPRR